MQKTVLVVAFIGVIVLVTAHSAAAQEEAERAVIRDFAGTVEVKLTPAGTWEAAEREQVLTGNSAISTGFRSTALIALGNTLLTVRPLTRLTITELSRSGDAERVDLNLETGRVRAEVQPPASGGIDFTVRSSAATASVRGTVFEFDTYSLVVSEGTVEFTGTVGSPVLIDAGGTGRLAERGKRAVRYTPGSPSQLRPALPVASGMLQPAEVDRSPIGGAAAGGTAAAGGPEDLSVNVGY